MIFTWIVTRDAGRISTWDTIEKLEGSPLWLPLGMLEGFSMCCWKDLHLLYKTLLKKLSKMLMSQEGAMAVS
jgi:hypothetical protein